MKYAGAFVLFSLSLLFSENVLDHLPIFFRADLLALGKQFKIKIKIQNSFIASHQTQYTV